MTRMTISRNTLTKSAAALAVTIGLAAQLAPTPAHAGKGALYFGAGVVTGVIINEAVRSNRGPGPDAGPPPRRRSAPPPRRRSSPPPRRRNRPVVKRERFDPVEVEKIQTALTTLGFDPGTVDGAMGRRTRTAIKGFQFEIDMKQTGRLTKAQKIILFDRAAAASATTRKRARPIRARRLPATRLPEHSATLRTARPRARPRRSSRRPRRSAPRRAGSRFRRL